MDDATLVRAQKAALALKEGRFDAALKIAKIGLKSNPKQAYLANLAGLSCVQLGNTQAAIPYFLTAWRSDESMIEAPRNLAQALILAGQPAKALEALEKALMSSPRDAGLRYLVASAHHAAGSTQDAITAANVGLEITPTSAALHTLRASAFEQIGDPVRAKQGFLRAVDLAPQDPETRRAYAQFLAFHSKIDLAFAQVKAGLVSCPDHEGLLLQKAGLHQAIGETAAASSCYEAILAQHPEHPLAANGLAYIVTPQRAIQVQKTIAKVMRKPTVSCETKMLLGYAQAHLAKAMGQVNAAQILTKANTTAAKIMPYDANVASTKQATLMAPFDALARTSKPSTSTPAPIFVIGLIRSGTSLMERILAQHPSVVGLGELARARHLADGQAKDFARTGHAPDGSSFAEAYRATLTDIPSGTTHFVDKMPDNFKVVGYLLNAFPNATILQMQRDPRDVALSMWASHFPTMAHSYANSMPAMAAHMNLYANTMGQWRALFPERIHTVSYENLVTNLEPTTRRIATLCGLDWHPDMLHPERSTSAVLTASVAQIRQPVHDKSIGKWQNEIALIAPFLAALAPDIWPSIGID